ncbi:MAG: ferrous iron transport protein B [Flavobacteriales bacterium]|nr:ferrous iron transport protein B [Flavobacteriales bacterium]
MTKPSTYRIILAGNPNSGKTSLFNALTGMNQRVGNYPGVTVDRKSGKMQLDGRETEVIDLPGAYSLYPKSMDEEVVEENLFHSDTLLHADLLVIVLDGSNLKRNLFLASQIIDLQMPTICVVNMLDVARNHGMSVQSGILSEVLGIPVVEVNAQRGSGIKALKKVMQEGGKIPLPVLTVMPEKETSQQARECITTYRSFHFYASASPRSWWTAEEQEYNDLRTIPSHEAQLFEITERYRWINEVADKVITRLGTTTSEITARLDRVLTHPVWGSIIFLMVFFLMFQALFTLAEWPMTWIDEGMGALISWMREALPPTLWADFITSGIMAGLAGVVVFIPQIVILFGLVTILEDSGYMARVSFLNDSILRKAGMNGKSIVPLVGGFACAVPAVMAARSIESMKERLITIFVTPLMSCSARLPVYVFLVSFVVPEDKFYGVFSLQGLFMLFLYLLGILISAVVGFVLSRILKHTHMGSFIMELPTYKLPRWQNVLNSMWSKGRTFVMEAGKIIVIVSMILWVLSSFGPPGAFDEAIARVEQTEEFRQGTDEQQALMLDSEKLRSSYAGMMGRFIEPAIQPLGFDWKIGIAIITSFAAREVFVGTMSTIYSVEGDTENIGALKEKLSNTAHPETGAPLMGLATAFSLAIFYVFAMQCMSTVAVVRKETNGWKWPMLQLVLFTALAYLGSLLTYQLLA